MIPTEHTAAPHAYEPPSSTERAEEALSWAGLAAVATIRVAELAVIAVAVLLVVPPLAILVTVVVLPAIVLAVLVALVASVVVVPVFVVRHAHRHRAPHAHEVVRRLVARAQRKL